VVIAGSPGENLRDRVVEVEWLLASSQLSLDSEYYICKNIIPPLERIFNLVGANVRQWYDEMPKFRGLRKLVKGTEDDAGNKVRAKAMIIESYMTKSTHVCAVCNRKAETKNRKLADPLFVSLLLILNLIPCVSLDICEDCTLDFDYSIYRLRTRLVKAEKKVLDLEAVCRSCSGISPGEEVSCSSQDCSVYYSRVRQTSILAFEKQNTIPTLKGLEGMGELDW
jgi:DNA polymerase zeta